MTKRLYDQSAYIKSFDALVLMSEQKDGETRVVLDQTAFFPEQGGQYADRGTLGGANVLDVQTENGIIYHTVDRPLRKGEAVHGEI
ncbi:MAG: alanine--tRNA ligase-related protein, partial [Eubacteriales bacterium]